MGRIATSAIMAATAVIALGTAAAQASTFTFDDIVYVSCTNFRCTNGASNFAAAFPYYTAGPGFSSSGYYQVISTNDGTTWSGLTTHSPGVAAPTYIFKQPGNGSSIGGEFIQNDPLNTAGIFPTESEDKLLLQGWSSAASGVNGATVDKVYTTSANSSYFEFTAPTGIGQPTTFTFNSFDLSGTASNVVFEVLDSQSNVLFTSQAYNLSSTAQHVVVNVPNTYKVLFTSGSSTGGALNMDNVEINDPLPAPVPEPISIAMLGVGLIGLGIVKRPRRSIR
jgi:PEP-CTERM motif